VTAEGDSVDIRESSHKIGLFLQTKRQLLGERLRLSGVVEHLLKDDLKLTVEFYDKRYRDYPVPEADSSNVLINGGEGFSRGVSMEF